MKKNDCVPPEPSCSLGSCTMYLLEAMSAASAEHLQDAGREHVAILIAVAMIGIWHVVVRSHVMFINMLLRLYDASVV